MSTSHIIRAHVQEEIYWTKINGGCQSWRKVVTHKSKSDFPLWSNKSTLILNNTIIFKIRLVFESRNWSHWKTCPWCWSRLCFKVSTYLHIMYIFSNIFINFLSQLRAKLHKYFLSGTLSILWFSDHAWNTRLLIAKEDVTLVIIKAKRHRFVSAKATYVMMQKRPKKSPHYWYSFMLIIFI